MTFVIHPVDPMALDLGTADQIAEVDRASLDAAGLALPAPTGPLGYAVLELPWRNNTCTGYLGGVVHPQNRRHGAGRALYDAAASRSVAAGRTQLLSGLGFSSAGMSTNAVRRLDLHGTPAERWEQADARVRDYDRAMAGRRQTVYRVMARHRASGAWAGLSLLSIDEFRPDIAFQKDTSVVRAHRGHRLGLLMKTDMLQWLIRERPEVSATDTWNSTRNTT